MPLRNPPIPAHDDGLALGLGIQFQAYTPLEANATASSPTSGRVFGTATYAVSGAVITGIKLRNGTAAAGTLPTTARFGLADNTGKILILSANLNALASWGTGVTPFAFTAPFSLTYTGVYFPCFIVNGTWGTTQPTPFSQVPPSAAGMAADGSNPVPAFTWTGQTDLPALGASLTMPADNRVWWMGLY